MSPPKVRFGKTVFAVNHQINKLLRNPLPSPRSAYIAPTFGQAKRISWDYYKLYTGGLKIKDAPIAIPHEQDLRIDYTHNQGRQMLLSGENYASIKGIYLDDGLLDEFGEMDPAVWTEAVRPTLNDRRGCATFIGTPKGRNHFHKLYEYATQSGDPEWFGCIYKASETGIIQAAELESARRTMSEEEYEQEYECSFNAGLVGAYFSKEMAKAEAEGRIGKFPYDPNYAVDTYWDLGWDDMTAVWFIQSVRGQHRCIDYYEKAGLIVADLMKDVKQRGYSLGKFVFPHDVEQKDLRDGKALLDQFHIHGARPSRVVPRCASKRESINAARTIMAICSFDREKCKRGTEALTNYMKKWNAKDNVFSESPLHNWASNGADAFQQFGMGQRGDSNPSDFREQCSYDQGYLQKAETSYNLFGGIGKR